jgi:transcriptional regulator
MSKSSETEIEQAIRGIDIKAEQLEWRRSKVIELRSRGLSQIEVARELQVSEADYICSKWYSRPIIEKDFH